jgi:hypothetical protein
MDPNAADVACCAFSKRDAALSDMIKLPGYMAKLESLLLQTFWYAEYFRDNMLCLLGEVIVRAPWRNICGCKGNFEHVQPDFFQSDQMKHSYSDISYKKHMLPCLCLLLCAIFLQNALSSLETFFVCHAGPIKDS